MKFYHLGRPDKTQFRTVAYKCHGNGTFVGDMLEKSDGSMTLIEQGSEHWKDVTTLSAMKEQFGDNIVRYTLGGGHNIYYLDKNFTYVDQSLPYSVDMSKVNVAIEGLRPREYTTLSVNGPKNLTAIEFPHDMSSDSLEIAKSYSGIVVNNTSISSVHIRRFDNLGDSQLEIQQSYDFSGNEIVEYVNDLTEQSILCGYAGFRYLYLQNNNISDFSCGFTVRTQLPQGRTVLNLSSNQISSLDLYSANGALGGINLLSNDIDTLKITKDPSSYSTTRIVSNGNPLFGSLYIDNSVLLDMSDLSVVPEKMESFGIYGDNSNSRFEGTVLVSNVLVKSKMELDEKWSQYELSSASPCTTDGFWRCNTTGVEKTYDYTGLRTDEGCTLWRIVHFLDNASIEYNFENRTWTSTYGLPIIQSIAVERDEWAKELHFSDGSTAKWYEYQ